VKNAALCDVYQVNNLNEKGIALTSVFISDMKSRIGKHTLE